LKEKAKLISYKLSLVLTYFTNLATRAILLVNHFLPCYQTIWLHYGQFYSKFKTNSQYRNHLAIH